MDGHMQQVAPGRHPTPARKINYQSNIKNNNKECVYTASKWKIRKCYKRNGQDKTQHPWAYREIRFHVTSQHSCMLSSQWRSRISCEIRQESAEPDISLFNYRAKLNDDRKHGSISLPVLKTRDPVLIKLDNDGKWEDQGTVFAGDPENRTHLINSPAVVLRRNRKYLEVCQPAEVCQPMVVPRQATMMGDQINIPQQCQHHRLHNLHLHPSQLTLTLDPAVVTSQGNLHFQDEEGKITT
ncbi:hypothetical protein PoB_000986300 [Plakobranchus ocellatus]|uniref:Protein DPCD n=1 Tax=Plakobranchus ocellatus TaxID=259542 RepID=A0AAV3YLF7_9GAST|nr:hypothetical protein PoB_000986300 [Plakobranchus ocellatus]